MNLLLVTLLTFLTRTLWVSGAITGTNPSSGTCLCMSGTGINIRSSACGRQVIGSANNGHCFLSTGQKQTCTLSGTRYEFFQFEYGSQNGWAAGNYIDAAPASSCSRSPASSGGSTSSSDQSYTCAIGNEGMRIHEGGRRTGFDCLDSNCGNTCPGGQCVAYVKCKCTRNGKYITETASWRPGTKVRNPDGSCNSNIPANTAIATFGSSGRYSEHAAVFVGCSGNAVRVLDQWCGRSIGYSTYGNGHRFYPNFAVITTPGRTGQSSVSCRTEGAGRGSCPKAIWPQCSSG